MYIAEPPPPPLSPLLRHINQLFPSLSFFCRINSVENKNALNPTIIGALIRGVRL